MKASLAKQMVLCCFLIGALLGPDLACCEPNASQTVNLGSSDGARSDTKSVTLEKQRFPDLKSPWENSLGMKFVPVPGTEAMFCVWETRNRDYRAFKEGHDSGVVKGHSLNGDLQPVVEVSWDDAKAFCAWLTEKERRLGQISSDQTYRLPIDWEWSVAVGLREAKGGSLKDKDAKTPDVYPWGNQWPPPKGAGNYGQPLGVDSFEATAPVGSFAANRLGLHDMGGNVWEWCEDWYDSEQEYRVLRGSCWGDYGQSLLSSYRVVAPPGYRYNDDGFRVVLSSERKGSRKRPRTWGQRSGRDRKNTSDTVGIFPGSCLPMTGTRSRRWV